MKGKNLCVILWLLPITLWAQNLDDVEGVWTGDKGLGNVYLYSDGTGYLTFTHDPDLKMTVDVSRQGNTLIVEQAEANRWNFYTYALDEQLARQCEPVLRPMRWELQLSADGETLQGRKLTTSIDYDKDTLELLSYDNDYVRDARWNRLEGNVSRDFEPMVQENNDCHIELINMFLRNNQMIVQFNITNLDHRDRDFHLNKVHNRMIDGKGRTWEEIEYVVVGSDKGNTWAGTELVQDVPIYCELAFTELPGDIDEIKVLDIKGNIFEVRFRDLPFIR